MSCELVNCADCCKHGVAEAKTYDDNIIRLKCMCHGVCSKCLEVRAKARPNTLLSCDTCSSPASPLDQDGACIDTCEVKLANVDEPGVWIYVDDSNIWIEAKKLASKVNRLKSTEDHRVRIEIGKLTDIVAKDRPVAQGFLYGSEPPAIDKVWKKIREHGWNVDPLKKSRMTGKEKMLDTKLVADVTERACTTPEEQRSTIILITGDADVIPAMEKVMKYKGWSLEVYMWKHALSSDIKKMTGDSVKVFPLDDYLKDATFTNMKFDHKSKNSKLIMRLKSMGVVFTITHGAFSENRVPTDEWCKSLESIAQWPFQYYWFERNGEQTDNLVLVFQGSPREGELELDVKHLLDTINDDQPLPFVEKAVTFLQFQQEAAEMTHYALDLVGRYSLEDICEGSDTESVHTSPAQSESKWELSSHKTPARHRSQRYSEPCPYKFNCTFGSRCYYKHTEEEKTFFRSNSGRGNPVRKVKLCNFHPNCHKTKEECHYAHGEDDAWCLNCRTQGHSTNNCPQRVKN